MTKIGIIGSTGKMGTQLAKGFGKNGHDLYLFAREPDKLAEQKKQLVSDNPELDVTVATDAKETAVNSDVLLLPLPHAEVEKVAEEIREETEDTIVVSISNPLKPDYSGLVTGWETSAGEELQKLLPKAKVVKAFNTIFAGRINNPDINAMKIDHFIAGEDEGAIETVMTLLRELGHNPIRIGGIIESRTLEHMAFVNIALNSKGLYGWNSVFQLIS